MTTIDFTKSEQYTLSIRLSTDGFSFSVFNPQAEEAFSFMSYPVNEAYSLTANVKELLISTEVFKRTYRQVNILVDTPRFTAIPFDLFEDDQIDDFFYGCFTRKDNEIVLCNILGKSNVVLLFGMDKHTHQLLHEHFPTARYYAITSPIIELCQTQNRLRADNRKLYAYMQKHTLAVFSFDHGRLQLVNSFSCKENDDRIYYLLCTWKQLGMDVEGDELYIASYPNDQVSLENGLKKFLQNVYSISPKTEFNRPFLTERKDVPFDMQALLLCE